MNDDNSNSPAHPLAYKFEAGVAVYKGLTKREEFAKAALQGLCAYSNPNLSNLAGKAVELADELLAELEKTK